MHLIVDGFGCDPERLSSAPAVRAFLDETPETIGMRAISPACVCPYQSAETENCGVSGFVIIAESHVAIHTWPARGVLWADIFSCKTFDIGCVLNALLRAFGIGRYRVQIVERGFVEPGAPPHSRPQMVERGVI